MPRLCAWSALRSGSPTPLREVDRLAYEHELDARDRGLVRRLVGTEVRRRATLRALATCFADGKPSADVRAFLHLGFVQLFYMDRIPEHAAVGETVRAAGTVLGSRKMAYVNAVLRSILRATTRATSGDPRRDLVDRDASFDRPVFRDPLEHPLLWAEDALSIPAPLLKRWTARHGEERALALAKAALDEPPLSLRVVRGETDDLARELALAEPRTSSHARVLLCAPEPGEEALRSEAFAEGRITVQGATALAAAELVEARAGERVLDLCAAPGGKTAVLAESGASVLACDADERRLARLAETLARLGLAEQVEVRRSDALTAVPERDFDAVLVDAPCSNTGVLAARPEARWRFGPKELTRLGELQRRLLDAGAEAVRPGGRLVWSTCSLEPEENGRLVRSFLEQRAAWNLEEEREALPEPGIGPVDGGYAARLRRR